MASAPTAPASTSPAAASAVEAASNGHIACLTALLEAPGISINAAGEWGDDDDTHTALTAAAEGGHIVCLRALLAADGIDTTMFGFESKAAIHWAAEKGRLECLRALLGAGVDADQEDDGLPTETALIYACHSGHAACARALVATERVDANHLDIDGEPPIIIVNKSSSPHRRGMALECARVLVGARGIGLGPRDCDGRTALHLAALQRNAEMASLLLVAGGCRFARETDPTDTRRTPLELADDSKEGKAVRAVFLSGVDYWQRRRHGGHSWAMRQVVLALLLVRQRLDAAPAAPATARRTTRQSRVAGASATPRAAAQALVHLPEEIWLLVCGFLRSADFLPRKATKRHVESTRRVRPGAGINRHVRKLYSLPLKINSLRLCGSQHSARPGTLPMARARVCTCRRYSRGASVGSTSIHGLLRRIRKPRIRILNS